MSDSRLAPGPRTLIATIIVLIAASLMALPAMGQATISSGNIQGTVTDPTGAVVPGATVTIISSATGQSIVRTTNASGAYSTGSIQPGTYKIRISAKGFQTTQMVSTVRVGVVSAVNVKLTLGKANQVVEVSSNTAEVNTEQPTVQGVLTAKQIEDLPVSGRNFLDLAQLEPGVQIQDGGNFDPTKNGFSSISFGGRAGRTARIELDGLDISDETVGTTTQNVSASAISEFQLSQSDLDLSTELTSSGAVNVVTKSGTNKFHGGGFYNFRDQRAGFAAFPGGQNSYFQRNQYGANLGGPIVKNKLFFFTSFERVKQDAVEPLVPEDPFSGLPHGFGAPFRDNSTFSRLDWLGPHNMRVFYHFNYNWNRDVSGFGGTYEPFLNHDNTPTHGIGVDFTTGNFTHSFRYGHLKFQNHIQDAVLGSGTYNPAGNIPVAVVIGTGATQFGPSFLAPQATFQENDQFKYDGSWVKGNHIWRYGVDLNFIRGGGYASFYGLAPQAIDNFTPDEITAAAGGPFAGGSGNPLNYPLDLIVMGNGQGFFTEAPAFNYPGGGQHDHRAGMYFGDSWKIKPNLTLTYGVRWSHDTGRSDSDLAPITCDQISAANFGGQVPCTGSSLVLNQFGNVPGLGNRINQPNWDFGPQVGFAWDPTGSGKMVIRGGGGLFYENAIFNNILFDRPGKLAQGLFWGYSLLCPSGKLNVGSTTYTSFPYNGGTQDIASMCGQPIGNILGPLAALQTFYQGKVAAGGATANSNFLGQTLASGNNSTGNNFIAPNYKTPESWQMNIGIQRQIGHGSVLSVDFLRNVSLHYLMGYDTNHVGDSRYLNKTAAENAIAATLTACGVSTIDAAIAACPGLHPATNTSPAGPATISDFASYGLDSGNSYLSGFPASLDGLTPNTGAAFAGINPLVGQNIMLFPIGRSVYSGLQVKLTQNMANPLPGIGQFSGQISYSLSRFNTMITGAGDQDFINNANNFQSPGSYFGPGALDRTNQLSFGGTFTVKHGPQLSLIGHLFSPLATTPRLQNQSRPGEIFMSDLNGDGTVGDILPGTNIGSFGRSLNASTLNGVINSYNSTYAGNLTPAGQALVTAGLFSAQQLVALGAVADSVTTAPSDQVNLGWLKTFDFKVDWPVKVSEGFTLHPSVGFFNLFNFANFDSPSNYMSGVLSGTAGSINGTGASQHDATRVGVGSGVNTLGSPREIEFGLRMTF